MDLADFSQKYSGIIGVFATLAIGLIGFFHYLSVKRAEERGKRYDRYHKLLEDLNVSPRGDAPFLDRQVAVVYEMRNFPEYYPVSIRILERSLLKWKSIDINQKPVVKILEITIHTLSEEALLTIRHIKQKQKEMAYFMRYDPDA